MMINCPGIPVIAFSNSRVLVLNTSPTRLFVTTAYNRSPAIRTLYTNS
jgi:hypothetical protein